MDIKKTIAQMTLEEKASLCSGLDFWHTKPVERLNIPSVMVSDGPHGLRKQDEEGDHLGINDSIKAVCFPPACATAAGFDRELIQTIGENVGDTCQHEKVSVVLGPAVNIKRSPLCGRNFEYFSEDPYLASEMAVGHIKGVQSRNVGVSVKHFAANSQENRRMSSNSVVDERTMREIYLPAFEMAVKRAKAWTVMCSYNRINGVFASENKEYLTDILRGEWGFDGYVMSDWGAVSDRVAGIAAGLDLEMPASGGANDKRIVDAVRAGELDEKDVDHAVECILTVSERYLQNAKPETPWDMEAQHELARKAAAECMVLLKNDGGLLPLQKGDSIAVIGKFAKEPRYQGGGSSHINSFKVTSLMDALEGQSGVTYAQGYDTVSEEPDHQMIAEAVAAAKAAKVAVIVAGLPDAFESEGYDRTHLRMPQCQIELIEKVAEANPNTVVVLYNGSPIEMPWLPKVKAVIEAYLGGQAVGGATMDVLFGIVNPCGHLPETFPLKLEDTPCYLTYGGEGDYAPYTEGVFVGYRYYDKKKMEVLFPFGYGLSYTSFQYSNLKLSADQIKDTDTMTVSVDVTNTGKLPGKDAVQLYVGDVESTVFRPVRELKGFEKLLLQPGETKTVTFTLDKRAFAYWNTQLHDWHVESGEFNVEIGYSSREIALSAKVMVESTVAVPVTYTMNSIFADLMKDPKAMAVLEPLLNQMKSTFGGGETDAAASAISEDMTRAMIMYMPLHGMLSFAGGRLSYEQLQAMVDAINRA
ncbi:MAG: glycoside hydrolase family 3 C-terminal domain-containing protein [Eubacteriales bacterium]|nr:glycoside hydrolase family 3 C-terminal domain-containing protein [Eubacteriales bacterium]